MRRYYGQQKYSKDFSELDISLPGNATGYQKTIGTQTYAINFYGHESALLYASAIDSKVPNITLYFFYSRHHSWPNTYACYALASDDYADTLCKTISGKTIKDDSAGSGANAQNVYLF